MSQDYKDKIDKLCNEANKGSTQAAQELLDEADKWSKIIDKLKEERDNNSNSKVK